MSEEANVRRVYKYSIVIRQGVAVIDMPSGADIKFVACQSTNDRLDFWAEVIAESVTIERTFEVFGTGHDIPAGLYYVGSALATPFVWHLYEHPLLGARP